MDEIKPKRLKTVAYGTSMGILLLFVAFAIYHVMRPSAIPYSVLYEGLSLITPTFVQPRGREPPLIIIANRDDLQLNGRLSWPKAVATEMEQIDFTQSFVVLALRGQKYDSGKIQKVERQGNTVVIHTNDLWVGPGNYELAGWSQPYEIISIHKDTFTNKTIHFVLRRETSGIAGEIKVFIPESIIPSQNLPLPTQMTPNAGTQKAILGATWSAITRTPFPTQVPLPTGTREGDMVKFSGKKLFLKTMNGWYGYLNRISVVIYAGFQPEDPEQGAIVIHITLPYRNFIEKVLTPTKHGGVRVVAEQNNRLTLLAEDGEVFYFDVPARRFVASLTEVVPTATPPPTYTPYTSTRSTP